MKPTKAILAIGAIALAFISSTGSTNALENGDVIRSTEPVPHFSKRGYILQVVQCSNKKSLGFYLAGKKASKIKKTRKGNYYAWINRGKTYYFPANRKIGFAKEANNRGYSASLKSGKPQTMKCR